MSTMIFVITIREEVKFVNKNRCFNKSANVVMATMGMPKLPSA